MTDPAASALLTDLYELTMLQAYYDRGMNGAAVFEFFSRKLPRERNFLMAAGLEQVLDYLCGLRITSEELAFLDGTGRFSAGFLMSLEDLRFTGRVDAMPEGTLFFADEPILRVIAPMPRKSGSGSRKGSSSRTCREDIRSSEQRMRSMRSLGARSRVRSYRSLHHKERQVFAEVG